MLGRLPVEAADETACGDEDLARHVLGQVADQVRVGGRDVLGWGGVERALHADVVEQAATVEVGDLRLVVGPVDSRVLAPGHTTLARTPCVAKLGGDGQRQSR